AHGLILGEHTGGRHDFDPVGAVLDLEADQLADLVRAVGDAGEAVKLEVWREAGEVVVPAGGPHSERRDQHARSHHVTPVDRVAQGDVDELTRSDVAHCGEARFERASGVDVGGDGDVDRAAPEEIVQVV